jgi:hypothetical protein
MKHISLKLPAALEARLAAAAKRRKTTKSAIVRQALEDYLANGNRTGRPSFADTVRDLIGCVDSGIPDLASNPKHMRGYGR